MKLKHALLSVLMVFLVACSPNLDLGWDGTIDPPSSKTYFSPPGWIQGVWAEDITNYHGFKFTNNDFMVHYDYSIGNGVSYNERINILSTKYLSCTEQISSTNYVVTLLHLSTNTFVYNFKYVSDNEISCHYEEDEWGEIIIEDYTLTRR